MCKNKQIKVISSLLPSEFCSALPTLLYPLSHPFFFSNPGTGRRSQIEGWDGHHHIRGSRLHTWWDCLQNILLCNHPSYTTASHVCACAHAHTQTVQKAVSYLQPDLQSFLSSAIKWTPVLLDILEHNSFLICYLLYFSTYLIENRRMDFQ